MKIPQLGTLEEVELRQAWSHEAHSFTPWLAEHLDNLAAVIGIPLELEGREVAVDKFSADILARNPHDDSLVLIENQLENTDHNHLGQIMTYLAGLEVRTVIWIAAGFQEAHLSAVRWLNDNTIDPFAFFAVKVKVVHIGNSPLAPVFEVLERPSQWERQLHALAKETRALTSIGQLRVDFWSHYLQRYPEEIKYGPAGGSSNRWRPVSACDLVISCFFSKKYLGLFFRGQRGASNEEVFEKLAPHADELAGLTGAEFGNPEAGYYFFQTKKVNGEDRKSWDDLADWLYQMTHTYENALLKAGV